jgi:hypothetical protein
MCGPARFDTGAQVIIDNRSQLHAHVYVFARRWPGVSFGSESAGVSFLHNLQAHCSHFLFSSDTAPFRQDVRSVTVTSNGLRYTVEAIDSIQMLYYMTILFPDPNEDTEKENPGLLPCRNAEIVLHTKAPVGSSHDADIIQLIFQRRNS